MSKFYARGGQLYLNDQPLLIQAGEFHYFRTPQDQWRQRLGLLKDAGLNALATYIPWLWHQLEEDESDFDGHHHPMRNLSGFLDLASEMGFWIIARPGPYIMAETINEGIPPWVFARYPQAAFISQDNKTQEIASYLHPDFLACVQKWYKAIFQMLTPRQVTRGGRIILIQLDNEMGMIQWVRNILDINPDTLHRFAAYLQKTYGDQLPEIYQAETLEEILREGITNPQAVFARKVVEDYRRFYRAYLREYASFLWLEARKQGLEVPPVINIHGFMNGGKTFPIGLSQLTEAMSLEGMLSATDVYPIFIGEGNFHQLLMVNEMTKALHNQEQPLCSVEFQAGGNNDFSGGQSSMFELHARLCISSGMRLINHYLFCDGENDPILSPYKRHDWGHPVRKDGSLRQHYHRYQKLSRALAAYGTDLVLAQPQYATTIGFILDHFMTEVNTPATKEQSDILLHQREAILFDFIARGLSLTQRPFNTLELKRSALDPSQIPVLWVMLERVCDADIQQKLVAYARAGGRLVMVGRICRQDSNLEECAILQRALGIQEIHSETAFSYSTLQVFQYTDVPASFIESYSGEFAEVFARQADGKVVGMIQPLGSGEVLVLGASLPIYTLDDLDIFRQIAERMDCQPMFHLTNWADVRISRGEKGSFLFINNYQDDPLETSMDYLNQPLLRGNHVRLPARSGAILPIE
jgi:beta-galactosidase